MKHLLYGDKLYPVIIDPKFLKGLRKLCDEKDIILIFDEIQCGMGRLGSLFAHDLYGVKPGEHGNTYGANPLCMTAVCAVFEIYDKLDLVGNVNKMAPVLKEGILDMCKKHPKTAAGHRGMGLMQGIVVTVDREAFERKAFDKGLLVCMAGADVIRFVPPLTITEDEIHKAMDMHGIRVCGYIRWSDRIYINVFCKSVAKVVWIFCSNLYKTDAVKMITEVDKARDAYHKKYAKFLPSDIEHKDLLIDSSLLGAEGTAKVIAGIVKEKFNV